MLWQSLITLVISVSLLCLPTDLLAAHKKGKIHYSFDNLMGITNRTLKKMGKKQGRALQDFIIAKNMYEINIQFLAAQKKLCHIPHIIHVFWLGPKAFPEKSIANLVAFKKYHPDWKMILWTDTPGRPPLVPGMEQLLLEQTKSLSDTTVSLKEKTDLFRYMVLYLVGGLSADLDSLPLRSLTPLADNYDFVTAFGPVKYHKGLKTWLAAENGLVLSQPRHPILAKALELAQERWQIAELRYPNPFDPRRAIYRTCDSFSKAATSLQNHGLHRDLILPASYFYARSTFTKKITKRLRKKGYVYAFHNPKARGQLARKIRCLAKS